MNHNPQEDLNPEPQEPVDADPAETPPAKPRPVRRPRRRRPNGRWTNPASPLQAARFARKEPAKTVIQGIRKLCPGHAGRPCKIDSAKISDYESRRRRPGIEHIESFCRYYQKSPEALGLITWRDEPPGRFEAAPPASPGPVRSHHDQDADREQLVDAWLRESVTSIATTLLNLLVRCPVNLTELVLTERPTTSPDHQPTGQPEPTSEPQPPPAPDPRHNGTGQPADPEKLPAEAQDAQPRHDGAGPARETSESAESAGSADAPSCGTCCCLTRCATSPVAPYGRSSCSPRTATR